MRVTNGRDGKKPVKVHVCGWHKDRGDTVCANSPRKQVDRVDGLVLGWIRDRVLHEEMVVRVLQEVRRRLAERAKVVDTEAPALEEQVARLKVEIANLTGAVAAGGGGTVAALVQAIRDREETVAMLRGQLRGLKTAPDLIGLETRRMEKEARDRLASFQRLAEGNPGEARRVLEALLDKPLVFTPTPQKTT
jgi:site-specific DNA recombinase